MESSAVLWGWVARPHAITGTICGGNVRICNSLILSMCESCKLVWLTVQGWMGYTRFLRLQVSTSICRKAFVEFREHKFPKKHLWYQHLWCCWLKFLDSDTRALWEPGFSLPSPYKVIKDMALLNMCRICFLHLWRRLPSTALSWYENIFCKYSIVSNQLNCYFVLLYSM